MDNNLPSANVLFRYTLALVLIGIGLSGRLGSAPAWIGAAILVATLPWGRIHWSKNVGGSDRVFRIALGLVLIGFTLTERVGSVPGWFGVALLVSAAIGRCPIYSLMGYKPPAGTAD